MNKNDFTNFNFLSRLYIKFKEKNLKSLEKNILELRKQIENEKKLLEQNKQSLERLTEENNSIEKDYEALVKFFEKGKKTITIKNNNFTLDVWENVFIKKKSSSYVIQTKREQDIYVFEENMNDFMDYLLTLNHSIIVLSVDRYRIVLQIRTHP
jgi:hypothetical protein